MKEGPIPFAAPMVRAILEDRKTATRRVVTFPVIDRNGTGCEIARHEINSCLSQGLNLCPYGPVGRKLWVREAWRTGKHWDYLPPRSIASDTMVRYEADGATVRPCSEMKTGRYRHARFMPRWASRITLEVTGIRVERLQEISREDAIAEGVDWRACPSFQTPTQLEAMVKGFGYATTVDYVGGFRRLWESLNGLESWSANPLVWVIEFRRVRP